MRGKRTGRRKTNQKDLKRTTRRLSLKVSSRAEKMNFSALSETSTAGLRDLYWSLLTKKQVSTCLYHGTRQHGSIVLWEKHECLFTMHGAWRKCISSSKTMKSHGKKTHNNQPVQGIMTRERRRVRRRQVG